MSREEVLAYVNKLIKSENGNAISEEDTIVSSGIDSLGVTIVFMELDGRYSIYPKEVFEVMDFSTITAKDIIDKVVDNVHK